MLERLSTLFGKRTCCVWRNTPALGGWLLLLALGSQAALASPRPKSAPLTSQRYLIELHEPSAATQLMQSARITPAPIRASQGLPRRALARGHRSADVYRHQLQQHQQRHWQQLQQRHPNLRQERQFDTLFNGFAVSAEPELMAQIAQDSQVKAVYPEAWVRTQLNDSIQLIGAGDYWPLLGGQSQAGAGVRVAIIDSGIRPNNPMFLDTGFSAPDALPNDDYCRQVDASFCNNKLIVARYVNPEFAIADEEYRSPLGFDGHGSHVAGIAVGNPVSVNYFGRQVTLSGVAPGAYLMVYKALFSQADNLSSSVGSNIMLLQALEWAVEDGADVINNSWGSNEGADPAFSPYLAALTAAEAAGIVITNAAGNAGPNEASISCPACIEAGLAVANSSSALQATEVLASSSSRGPNGDIGILKPDITAPGSNILSAYSPDQLGQQGPTFVALTGTSMASPHVAGAAALLRQQHPDWDAIEIKTALMSSAEASLFLPDGNTPATPFAQGAGRLSLAALSQAQLTFNVGSLVDPTCYRRCTLTLEVTNQGSDSDVWQLDAQLDQASVSLNPSTLTLAPQQSANITLTIDNSSAISDAWLFGQVQLQGRSNAQLPLVVRNSSAGNEALLWLDGDDALQPEQTTALTATFSNTQLSGDLQLNLLLPETLQMVGVASVFLEGATQTGLTQTADQRQLQWQGRVQQAQMRLSPINPTGLTSLANSSNQLSCSGRCDEVSLPLTLPTFEFNQQSYQQVTLSDNGLVRVGNGSTSGSYNNQALPDTLAPNNLLAPLWADFDLQGDNSDQDGAGTLHRYQINQQGQAQFTVLEWVGAQLYNDNSGRRYQFQIWLGHNQQLGQIWFHYPNIAALPNASTIGAENLSGQLGTSYYHNGRGQAVTSGTTLSLQSQAAGQVALEVELSNNIALSINDDNFAIGLNETAELAPLANDNIGQTVPVRLQLQSSSGQYEITKLLAIGDPNPQLQLLSNPTQGQVTLTSNNRLRYQPTDNASGQDNFRYQVLSSLGQVLGEAQIQVQLGQSNSSPSLAPINNVELLRGERISLTLSGSDPDNDPLHYQASQIGGNELQLSLAGAQLTIGSNQAGQYDVNVVASDGQQQSRQAFQVRVLDQGSTSTSSGGGSGVWFGAMLLLGWLTRRWRLRTTPLKSPSPSTCK
ncbi:MAG: S8 family serine peptidase [Ferrimonas sp.]